MRGFNVGVLELDEIWSYIGARRPSAKPGHPDYFGDRYLHTAISATSNAMALCADLRDRVISRPQITTDGHGPYLAAMEEAFGANYDFAELIRSFEGGEPGPEAARRYSPGLKGGIDKFRISGNPRPNLVTTAFAERSNLIVRMQARLFTRLTNACSKTLEGHAAAVHLFVCWYDPCWVHSAIRTTLAIALGVTDSIWTVADLVAFALDEGRAAA